MENILVLAYPGLGKTFVAENYSNVIDFEQQHYTYIYDEDIRNLPLEQIKSNALKRKPNPEWPNNFIEDVRKELTKDKIVISTFIPSVYKALCVDANYKNIKIVLVVFDKSNFEELAERFRKRGNTEEFIERRRADFFKVIEIFEESCGIDKIVVNSGEYLADALIKHGIELKRGKGLKNYF